MNPEDLIDPGTYIDPLTGDVWEKRENGKWYVNGLLHKPFPLNLVPEQEVEDTPQDRRLRDIDGYCE
jgi:hypothetical protein